MPVQTELSRIIEQVSREKGIDRAEVIEAVEQALLSAARRELKGSLRLEAKYNPEIGDVELFRALTVVKEVKDPDTEISLEEARARYDAEAQLGDEILEKLDQQLTRIAAQAARQNLQQRLREAERAIIYNEFKNRKGEITQLGTVQRVDRRDIIVNLGRTEAILPEKEQIPRERYRQGDRIRAYILDVEMSQGRGPRIVLSRTHPGFLIKLFEHEVPEIAEGIIEVKGAAREPGVRAKIAVVSKDPDVDPVGACVGPRGARVQAVTQELRGEKIDIVTWSPDPAEFVCQALSPAKVSRIIIDDDERKMEIIVPDDQLSLAIGRRGQNVRLASRLTGFDLTVKSESEVAKEQHDAQVALMQLPGVDESLADRLFEAGIKSVEDLAQADVQDLADETELDIARIRNLVDAARRFLEETEAREGATAAEGELAGENLPPDAGGASNSAGCGVRESPGESGNP
ncbi:MAG: transcription termination/antitermination protein NusA [Candidatus Binatia bacterium]|nr:MAG: transcription termination/antitermination protein NusA [Candidatus Binatia bacterium]